eukprot:7287706-Alexandrium_andersonii.AAC.1
MCIRDSSSQLARPPPPKWRLQRARGACWGGLRGAVAPSPGSNGGGPAAGSPPPGRRKKRAGTALLPFRCCPFSLGRFWGPELGLRP